MVFFWPLIGTDFGLCIRDSHGDLLCLQRPYQIMTGAARCFPRDDSRELCADNACRFVFGQTVADALGHDRVFTASSGAIHS